MDLAERKPEGWTLIGAQMVALHGMEHGKLPPRSSEDLDILVNIRLITHGTEEFSRLLLEIGMDLDGSSPTGLAHRFVGRGTKVDILAPDGAGERAHLTTIPPGQTVMVPGGTKALAHTERVQVRLGDRIGEIPRPDMLGALVIKSCAVDIDDAPENQRRDLVFLLSLVGDPRVTAAMLDTKERAILRRRSDLLDRNAPAWRSIDNADDAHLALRILAG
ncbi:MAG TPA: hypothetical protein VKQ27_00435 [Acetobacteraceae bacterium]|nr:hypothetical protein [Acetobacteraceae bacterium]